MNPLQDMNIKLADGREMRFYDSSNGDLSYLLMPEGQSANSLFEGRRRLSEHLDLDRMAFFTKFEFDPETLEVDAAIEAPEGFDGEIYTLDMAFTPDFGEVARASVATRDADGKFISGENLAEQIEEFTAPKAEEFLKAVEEAEKRAFERLDLGFKLEFPQVKCKPDNYGPGLDNAKNAMACHKHTQAEGICHFSYNKAQRYCRPCKDLTDASEFMEVWDTFKLDPWDEGEEVMCPAPPKLEELSPEEREAIELKERRAEEKKAREFAKKKAQMEKALSVNCDVACAWDEDCVWGCEKQLRKTQLKY